MEHAELPGGVDGPPRQSGPLALVEVVMPRWVFHALLGSALVAVGCLAPSCPVRAGTLEEAQARGVLIYGTDTEGGAPYIYPDPEDTSRYIGFEKDLMDLLGNRLGLRAEHDQQSWDRLLQVLRTGRVDLVCNGFELTEDRQSKYLATRPYFVYQLQLIGKRGGDLVTTDALRKPKRDGRLWRVGVLTNSVADRYAHELAFLYEQLNGAPTIEPVRRDSVVDAVREVQNGQIDGTIQDDLAARHILKQEQYADLRPVGPPQSGGYYVIYCRQGDEPLRDSLDAGIEDLLRSGQIKRLYDQYGIWSPAQEELATWEARKSANTVADRGAWRILLSNWRFLREGAIRTIVLSCASMPLAMVTGLFVALGRMYGPKPLRHACVGYIELIRGTPLMLQLFVLYILLPEVGIVLPDMVAGILGLGLNYSAYEAEIYRTGLQAVPPGQMEAAQALGMSHSLAIKRVVLPQALRIVIPPVTSDFITLLKDSSVCSAIGIIELSKYYSILANNNGHVVMFAAVVAGMYLVMSLPLSRLAHLLERRLDAGRNAGRTA